MKSCSELRESIEQAMARLINPPPDVCLVDAAMHAKAVAAEVLATANGACDSEKAGAVHLLAMAEWIAEVMEPGVRPVLLFLAAAVLEPENDQYVLDACKELLNSQSNRERVFVLMVGEMLRTCKRRMKPDSQYRDRADELLGSLNVPT